MPVMNVVVAWSGGKDCCLALYKAQQDARYEIKGLLSTVVGELDIIGMHDTAFSLIENQAESLSQRLLRVTYPSSKQSYEANMAAMLDDLKREGVTGVVFGDIFLRDLRANREKMLAGVDMKGVFPLWDLPAAQITHEFLSLGFKAVVTNVDTQRVEQRWLGKNFDDEFLRNLPPKTDLCGENGEFHTFVYDGPLFKKSVEFAFGEMSSYDNGRYCSLRTMPRLL